MVFIVSELSRKFWNGSIVSYWNWIQSIGWNWT